MAKYAAQCRCGETSITLSAEPVAQLVCHCVDCQKVTGNDFTQIAFFLPDGCEPKGAFDEVTMPGGSSHPKTYYNCPKCGSCLYATVSVLKGQVGVVAEQIQQPFEFKPKFHVWTSEKAEGVEVASDALQFPRGPNKPPHLV
ncbi:MAG: GFA family protein [Gammaproteobacteria bacterium]|nr:GFA family protein [Gammaproteobacteria bacterium]